MCIQPNSTVKREAYSRMLCYATEEIKTKQSKKWNKIVQIDFNYMQSLVSLIEWILMRNKYRSEPQNENIYLIVDALLGQSHTKNCRYFYFTFFIPRITDERILFANMFKQYRTLFVFLLTVQCVHIARYVWCKQLKMWWVCRVKRLLFIE